MTFKKKQRNMYFQNIGPHSVHCFSQNFHVALVLVKCLKETWIHWFKMHYKLMIV